MGLETNKVKYKELWKLVRLKELCDKITDGTHFTPKYESQGIPFISVKDIFNEKVHFEKCKFISSSTHQELIKRCNPEKDDILITKSGTIGRMALVPDTPQFSLFVSVALIKNKRDLISSKFLIYTLHNFLNSINIAQDIKGGLLKNFHLEDIRETLIPVVSFIEQQAIVSKIEELFSELDKGVEQLKIAQQQLKTYRQAVLKWAFEGRFTNKNVIDGELPKGWNWVDMGDVIEKPKYGTSKKCEYGTKGVGVLRIPNIVKGVVESTDLKFAQFDQQEVQAYGLKEGDILTIRSNGSVDIVGKCALISKKDEGLLYAGYLIRLRSLKKLILPKFLLNILSSIGLRNQIEEKAKSTSGVNNINSEELAGLKISLPPIEEQNNIVQEIESRLSVADKMEETINQSLQQAETLRQSILKMAFEGRLVE